MLDSIQFFFILASLAYLAFVVRGVKKVEDPSLESNKLLASIFLKGVKFYQYLILGILIGLGIAVKHNGAIMLVLPVILITWEIALGGIWLRPQEIFGLSDNKVKLVTKKIKYLAIALFQIVAKLLVAGIAIFVVYLGVFAIHFNLTGNRADGDKYKTLYDNRYTPSTAQNQIINEGKSGQLLSFPDQIIDNWNFMDRYHKGVPKLDLAKADENGSYPSNWLVMNRTISFRWETADGENYRYSYLIGNPLIWLISLLAVIFGVVLILGSILFNTPIRNKRLFAWILTFTGLYGAYMYAMLDVIQVRVLYLYHYLVALLFAMILSSLIAAYFLDDIKVESEDEDNLFNNRNIFYGIMTLMVIAVIGTFIFYSPFTYYQPLSAEQFKQRALFDFWLMRPAK